MTRALSGLLLIVLAGWCCFWWGYYAGFRSANLAELSNARFDARYIQSIRSPGEGIKERPVEAYAESQQQRIDALESASQFSLTYFALAPILAPMAAQGLGGVRQADRIRE